MHSYAKQIIESGKIVAAHQKLTSTAAMEKVQCLFIVFQSSKSVHQAHICSSSPTRTCHSHALAICVVS